MNNFHVTPQIKSFLYPVVEINDPSREQWDAKAKGAKLLVDYSRTKTPQQIQRDQIITYVSLALIASVGALLLSSYLLAAGLTIAAAVGIRQYAKLGIDLDNPEVRKLVVQQFFNSPLEQFAETYSINDVFDYQLLPTQLDDADAPMSGYSKYAVIATRYQKNKENYTRDVRDIQTESQSNINTLNKASELSKAFTKRFEAVQNKEIARLKNFANDPVYKVLYLKASNVAAANNNEVADEQKTIQEQSERLAKQWQLHQSQSLENARASYKQTLRDLEGRFKEMLPKAQLPVATPVR